LLRTFEVPDDRPHPPTSTGAGATLAAAALPAVAVAEVVMSGYPHYRQTFTRWDGLWPDDVFPGQVIDGDIFIDHFFNAIWRYERWDLPGWVYTRRIDYRKPERMRENSL
jgi:hypothetical protein